MSKLASGSETFPNETLKDVRLWLRVLCRINQQLIQASTALLRDSSLI